MPRRSYRQRMAARRALARALFQLDMLRLQPTDLPEPVVDGTARHLLALVLTDKDRDAIRGFVRAYEDDTGAKAPAHWRKGRLSAQDCAQPAEGGTDGS